MAAVVTASLIAALAQTGSAGTPLHVPSDPKAAYTILEVGGTWPDRTVITRRDGPSGVSYSKRLYDCENSTVKYLGSGDSLEAMEKSKPDPQMAPIADNSIAYYVGLEICKR